MTIRKHTGGVDAYNPQDVVVAVFDVLGFRSLVAQYELHDLGERYRELLRLKRHAAYIPVLSLSGVDEWESPSAVFSDTIVFWAHAQLESADSFLATCSVLLAESLDHGWLLRGAVAAGNCILDRDARVFIGQPIIDAYLLQQAQNWIGAALHPTCIDHPIVGRLFVANDNVIQYEPPLKPDYSTSIKYAIEWASRTTNWEDRLTTIEQASPPVEHSKFSATREFIKATRAKA